jgi:hypothetical protein
MGTLLLLLLFLIPSIQWRGINWWHNFFGPKHQKLGLLFLN